MNSVKLNYRLTENGTAQMPPLVMLHGLFGDLNNLGSLTRALQRSATTLQVDLRNHGRSPHSEEMSYPLMAKDILQLLDQLNLPSVTVIGHSMGGKVAMALTAMAPERVTSAIILDIAPIVYHHREHDTIFVALQRVIEQKIITRQEAEKAMEPLLDEPAVAPFLLKSFAQGQWRFNLPALLNHYDALLDWREAPPWAGPILFLKGANSPYIQQEYLPAIQCQFPLARCITIADSRHWLHADQPEATLDAVTTFLNNLYPYRNNRSLPFAML